MPQELVTSIIAGLFTPIATYQRSGAINQEFWISLILYICIMPASVFYYYLQEKYDPVQIIVSMLLPPIAFIMYGEGCNTDAIISYVLMCYGFGSIWAFHKLPNVAVDGKGGATAATDGV